MDFRQFIQSWIENYTGGDPARAMDEEPLRMAAYLRDQQLSEFAEESVSTTGDLEPAAPAEPIIPSNSIVQPEPVFSPSQSPSAEFVTPVPVSHDPGNINVPVKPETQVGSQAGFVAPPHSNTPVSQVGFPSRSESSVSPAAERKVPSSAEIGKPRSAPVESAEMVSPSTLLNSSVDPVSSKLADASSLPVAEPKSLSSSQQSIEPAVKTVKSAAELTRIFRPPDSGNSQVAVIRGQPQPQVPSAIIRPAQRTDEFLDSPVIQKLINDEGTQVETRTYEDKTTVQFTPPGMDPDTFKTMLNRVNQTIKIPDIVIGNPADLPSLPDLPPLRTTSDNSFSFISKLSAELQKWERFT